MSRLIALDVGNTDTKAARWTGTAWSDRRRWPSTPAAVRASLAAYLQREQAPVGLVSVVPALVQVVEEASAAAGVPCRVVRATDADLPLRMGYATPETLGADRIAAACAAHARYGRDEGGASRAVLVVDAGTACTLEVVDASGLYRGGAIAPGPRLLAAALSRGTAQLPEVEAAWPDAIIGRSTREAIQAGVMVGFVGAVDRLLREAERALGARAVRVATGGHAAVLARHVPFDAVVPDLVLDGVRLVAGPSLGVPVR